MCLCGILALAGSAVAAPWIHGVTDKDPLSYKVGEPIVFTLSVEGSDALPDGVTIPWSRTGDDGVTAEGVWDGKGTLVVTTSLARAGFVRLTADAKRTDGSPWKVDGRTQPVFFDGGAAADVASLKQTKSEPADYDAFWAKCREELASVPIKEELKEIPSPTDGVRLYEARIACPGGTGWTTGFLSVPTGGAKVPVVASFAGYGASWGAKAWTPPAKLKKDEIAFRVTAHGFELGRDSDYYSKFHAAAKSNGYGHGFDPKQNARPETCYFHGMALRVLRAVEYLKTRPEWNGRDLIVSGGSQASLQSMWCAAFVPGVTEARISIPWLCDVGGPTDGRNHGAWYPEWAPGLDYFDQVNAARRVPKTCRVTVSRIGLGDYTAPPCGATIMYAVLRCPKSATWVQGSTHGYTPPNAQKTVRRSSRPEIAWSVMHPTELDPDYMQRVADKAVQYGGVDSFEMCGRCGYAWGGINGILDYAPYPKTAAAIDRKYMELSRQRLNRIVEIAHSVGKPIYYWHREGYMPKTLLQDIPGLLDEDGEYDLLGKPYLDYLRWKVKAAFDAVPELDGIVLTLTEADISIIHNSNAKRYPSDKVVDAIGRIFVEELEKRGKRFILRSFGSMAKDYEDLLAGARLLAKDHRFEIETKATAYDFDPFLPPNPFLKKEAGCTLGAECDGMGEYFGAGYLPAAQVPVIQRYVSEARERGVDRFTIRIDRVGNNLFDSAQEVNIYAYMRFIRDPQATAEDVMREWAAKRWKGCEAEMSALAALGFQAVSKTQFIDRNVIFHQNPPGPSMKYIKSCGICSVFRDEGDLHMTDNLWGMLHWAKAPGRAAIRAEKDEAVMLADMGLRMLEGLKDRLPEDEYARHHRAWSILTGESRAVRAFVRALCAYFDDMASGDAQATSLAAAVARGVAEIEALMKDKSASEKGMNTRHCVAMGEDLDYVYYVPLRFLTRELLREFKADFAAHVKMKARKDIVDYVIPGGIYDDYRVKRTAMHGSYQSVDSGVPVRFAGNPTFPNGTITVEFRDIPGARVVVDLDRTEPYAQNCRVVETLKDGIRTVSVFKSGGSAYPAIRSIAYVGPSADPVEALEEEQVIEAKPCVGWSQADCIDGRTDRAIPVYGPGEEMTFIFCLRGFKGQRM